MGVRSESNRLDGWRSAPEAMVQDVIESLREIGPVRVTNLPGVEENVEFRLPVELQSV